MNSRLRIVVGAALALALAFPTIGRADDKDKVSKDWTVEFGQPQPQSAPAAVTHFLMPNDLTIQKGDTVTFVVNGGGHGIAIHRVNKKTTRDDVAADLCQGPAGTDESDRAARATVCNGVQTTLVDVNGTPTVVTGTQNLDYTITDAKDDVIIHTGFNLTAGPTPPANSNPPQTIDNPRTDDPTSSERLLATSGRAPAGDNQASSANRAGAFLAGTTAPTPPANPTGNPGNRIQVRFNKTGRFLVICMNRGHSLNDHMFGFVTVTDDDDDKDQ
jgi:plastocyanin